MAEYYVAYIRWTKKIPVTSGKGHGKTTVAGVESGEEIYPITANSDGEAITQAKNAIQPSQARGESGMERRIVKFWKVQEIKID